MSLFDKLKNKRSSLQEKKDDTTGRGKKPIKVNLKNLVDKAKKNPLNKNLGVKITDTDNNTIKQSEVSKKAKQFTTKINKANVNRKEFPGDKSGAYQRVKKDIETKNLIKKAGGSGDIGFTAPDRKTKVAKRTTRAVKQGTPDPFKVDTSRAAKENQKIFTNIGTGSKGKPLPVSGFGKGITKGQANVKDLQKSAFKKTQPSDVQLPKSFTDFTKKLKTYKGQQLSARTTKGDAFSRATSTSGSTEGSAGASGSSRTKAVNQADVSRRAKKFSQNISNKANLNKVQMRGGASNIPAGPPRPPKKYNIPADDRPGALAQGRDFPSKKKYDAKLENQVKILRGKAANLRKKQIQVAKTTPTKGTPEYTARSTGVKKIGRRMKQRTAAADALERSLKRKGTVGPTGMLPVVSGKSADTKMPGMGGKTYNQFYKDANVGAKQPPKKVKSTPPPDTEFKKKVEDTYKKAKKSKVTSNYSGSFRNTSAFDKRVARMSRGFGGNRGKRAALGKVGKFIKNKPGKAGLIALGAYAAYEGGKRLFARPDYDKNKIRQTGIIKDKSGQNVQFKYGDKKNPASPVLTKDKKVKNKIIPGSLTKFRTGAYTAKDTKSGLNINIDKNMKGSAFEKQLQRAEKGTGFLGRQTSNDRTFLKKYKNATRPGTK